MKNNKPKYLIIDFEAYEAQRLEEMKLDKIVDRIKGYMVDAIYNRCPDRG
jgi:hypothetical protein